MSLYAGGVEGAEVDEFLTLLQGRGDVGQGHRSRRTRTLHGFGPQWTTNGGGTGNRSDRKWRSEL